LRGALWGCPRGRPSYLTSTQQQGGGWDNIDSTSWAQTAINGMIEVRTAGYGSENAWTSSAGLLPTDALAKAQQPDGGVDSPNRAWSTSYALVAASGKSWNTVLGSFPKPAPLPGNGTNGNRNILGASTSTAATLPLATTSTSTIAVVPDAISPDQTDKTSSKGAILSFVPRHPITKIPHTPRKTAVLSPAAAQLPNPAPQMTDGAPANSPSSHPSFAKKNYGTRLYLSCATYFKSY